MNLFANRLLFGHLAVTLHQALVISQVCVHLIEIKLAGLYLPSHHRKIKAKYFHHLLLVLLDRNWAAPSSSCLTNCELRLPAVYY